jgi:hypothetical protein
MAAIDIPVKGLDEVLRKLGEEEEGLTVPKLNEWAQKILEEARLHISTEEGKEIRLRFVEKEGNQFDIELHVSRPYVRFVKQAIEMFLTEMPATTASVFQDLLNRIEHGEVETKG